MIADTRALLLVLALVCVLTGCRRKSRNVAVEAPPPPETAAAETARGAATGAPAAEPARTYQAPPPTARPSADPAQQFMAPEPMNMYAPAGPGDYQAQLNSYNRVLRKWTEGADVPATFHDLMATYNSPKPPQPPAGRRLVYDRKTVTLRLQ